MKQVEAFDILYEKDKKVIDEAIENGDFDRLKWDPEMEMYFDDRGMTVWEFINWEIPVCLQGLLLKKYAIERLDERFE